MIKVKNGDVECRGTMAELCMEISFAARQVRKIIEENLGGKYADEKISEAFENSKLSDEEIRKKFMEQKKLADKALTEFADLLKELLK